MIVHRDGYIMASVIEIDDLPAEVVMRAQRVGDTLLKGVERELEQHLGIKIDGMERARVVGASDDGVCALRIESSWVRPSRR